MTNHTSQMSIKHRELRFFERFIALVMFVALSPLLLVFFILIKTTSRGPYLYIQKRTGKDMKPFWIYKIRTMVEGAEGLKSKVQSLNEADGPVFKIRQDPRYTKIGAFLSHTALDELPQLINIVKGEMAFVGPRPLPIEEAIKVPKKYHTRFSVLPGMTSTWIIEGAHALSFKRWMELDCEYARNKSVWMDIQILLRTIRVVFFAAIKG